MRKLMWFTIGFAAACAFGAYCSSDWMLSIGLLAGAIAVILLYLTRFCRPARVAAAILVGIFAGGMMFEIYDTRILSDARELDGQTLRQTVVVHDYSYQSGFGCAVDGTVELNGRHYKVRVYLNEYVKLEPGDRLIAQFRFRYTSSGGLDEVLYHRSEAIFLMAYQRGNCVIERCWSTPWKDYPVVWRQELLNLLDAAFPSDTAGFAKALLLGDRTDIDYATNTSFKVSGISHIIAVSGLHVSILFGLIYFLSGKRRFLTFCAGFPVLLLFAAIVGFTPSVTRAAVMQIMMMLSMLLKREYDAPTELAFSALIMLVWNPLVIASVSFQLSFACMAGIFLFAEPIRNWLQDNKRLGSPRNGFEKGLISSVSISLSASVLTTPLVAFYFGTVSLIAPLTNLLTLWVITFIFYGVMAAAALCCVNLGAAAAVGAVISWPIRYVLGISKTLAAFPLAAVYTKSVYVVAWLIFAYVLLGLYLSMKEKKAALFSGLVLATLCLSLGLSWAEPLMDNGRMTMLDVGQGQAILLQSGGKTFLVDCGGDYDDDAADITAETLISQGISRLDGIILTHYDRDHAGGVENLLRRIRADVILAPHSFDENGVLAKLRALAGDAVQTVPEDTVLAFEDVKITLFAPESYNSGNESSMCILFQAGNYDILITGDRGIDGERLLLRHDLPAVEVLVVGHHGSKHSTSEALLEAVQPAYAFISVSESNSYGHPSQEVLDRLREFGCMIFRTDEDGTVTFRW